MKSKGFRKIALIVGVAALVVTGIGIFASAAAGTALGITATIAQGIGLPTLLGVSAAALSIGLAPSPKSLEETGAAQRNTPYADPSSVGVYAFGTTQLPLALIYEEQSGASPDRVVHDIFAHCWHRIQSYVSLSITTDDGPQAVGFSGNAAVGSFANVVWWFRADGTQSAALSGSPFDNNSWPTTAVFKGYAHSALVWNVDDPGFTSLFSGMPSKIDVVAQCAWLYDPRLDNDYGSGSQQFDDPSTWTFNDGNASLVLLRYLIGEYNDDGRLIWGRGAQPGDIDMDSFIAAANVADETRDGVKRYKLGGIHGLDGDFESFVRQWEEETGGKLSKPGGIFKVWLPNDDLTPLTTIDEGDLLANASIEHIVAGGIENLYNVARGRFISAGNGYLPIPYDDVVEDDAVTEDGTERILSQDFSWIQDESSAQRIARYKIRRSRFQRIWTIPLAWKCWHPNYKPFTVHYLNCAETGYRNQLVRVIDRRRSPTGAGVLVVQQEDPSLYDDTVPLNDPLAADDIPKRIDRLGTVTARRISTDSATDATATITAVKHTPDGQGFNDEIVSLTHVPSKDCNIVVSVSCTVTYAVDAASLGLSFYYSIQQDASFDSFQRQNWAIGSTSIGETYTTGITLSRTFACTAGVSTTFKFMASKLDADDTVTVTNTEMSIQVFPA